MPFFPALFTGHGPTRGSVEEVFKTSREGSGQEVFEISRVGSGDTYPTRPDLARPARFYQTREQP